MRLLLILLFTSLCTGIFAQIVNVEDRRANFVDTAGMYERLDLGFNFIKNDDEIFSFNTDFQIEFLQSKRLFLSITKFTFLKAGDENFVNTGLQHLRYNYHVSDLVTWEVFGQIQYNEQLRIRLRGLAGTGPRFTMDIGEKNGINLGLSYMWEYDEIAKSNEVHHDSRLNSYLSLFFNLSPVIISSTTYYQPLFNQLSDYRMSNNTTVAIKFHKNWSFKTSFNLNYDSRLPDDVPDLVYSVSNGIRYRF